MSRHARTLCSALLLTLALPAAASAHGLGEDAAGRSTLEFVPLGIEHMVLGWDHLLFILGVVLLAAEPRRAVKMISIFAAGHSLTLIVASLAEWQLSATFVDVVIALSLVFVGVLGVRGRDRLDWSAVGWAVFGFGLVHGLGLSTRLQDAGLSDDGLLGKIIAFNVGIELGQIAAIAFVVLVGRALVTQLRDPWETARHGFAGLIVVGLVASAVLSFPGDGDAQHTANTIETDTAATQAEECTAQGAEAPQFQGGAHPPKLFFPPGETATERDLIHVITDGYVVIRYRPDASAGDLALIERATSERQGIIAVPSANEDAAVRLQAATRQLTCGSVDLAPMLEFSDRWFDDLRSGRASL